MATKIKQMTPLVRLRIFVLCGSVLFADSTEAKKFISHVVGNIDEIADRYDFENLDEVFYFI